MISGVIPALPLIVIRPFLPESPAWEQKRAAGTLKRPSIAQLFTPELRRTTIVTTLMFAFAYGAAFGAIQQMPRIVPGLDEVRVLLRFRDKPEETCGDVNALLDEHIGHVSKRIKELRLLERQLKDLRQRCGSERSAKECGVLTGLSQAARDTPATMAR